MIRFLNPPSLASELRLSLKLKFKFRLRLKTPPSGGVSVNNTPNRALPKLSLC
jgi:hypothetical protein